ncbi:unnamed protein product [Acanthoscelides obtectus]|uniref:Neurotransmitter-gated ion-channel ligand-binding domain-containing protein n=1 Tax=Acanthoscelides obtectus TaxID=200917 RepID=A0A9P0Q121_ACAOB|nr:unnamed protein product [Acanthoscelides obtectus]CAK1656970.1 Neuronal acetylcholine receptor subunit alpha-5 [Acanthoscelides obtectus]
MSVRNFIVVVVYISAVAKAFEDRCPESNSERTHVKLKDAILCLYDNSVRPVANHQNSTAVSFRLILKFFTFDIHNSIISFDAWMPVHWKDEHLTWNPADHEDIKTLHLHTSEIWTPDLSVYNRADQSDEPSVIGYSSMKCAVTYDGSVLCVPPIHIDALCNPDLSKYPFDSHNCTLNFGSWVYKGEEVDIKLVNKVVNDDDLVSDGEWTVQSFHTVRNSGVYKCCPNSTYPSVSITFTIRRLSGAHAATVIIPCIVAVILTFALLALSPLDRERLIMSYVNLVVQLLQVQFISWQIPLRGDNIPLLIVFARDSVLLSVFAIVFTILFKKIMERKTTPPYWISKIISFAVACPIGQIILLKDFSVKGVASAKGEEDGATIVNSETTSSSQDWEILGKILDKIFFILYIIIYFIMTVAFIP